MQQDRISLKIVFNPDKLIEKITESELAGFGHLSLGIH